MSRRTTHIFKELLINGQIRCPEVRLIGMSGDQLGIMPTAKAMDMARVNEVDLCMINATAAPPVCKLMDYRKYRFDYLKKEKDDRKNRSNVEMKDLWLSQTIDIGDVNTKAKHARKFLEAGNKVRLSIRMKGRQQAHPEVSVKVMEDFFEKVADLAVMEKRPLQEGRTITMIVAPNTKK